MSVYDWLKITMDHAMGVDWPMGNVHVTGDTSLVALEGASVIGV